MSTTRRRATIFLLTYLALVVTATVVHFAFRNSSAGFIGMWLLGMPWSMVSVIFSWFLAHNYTRDQIVLLHLGFTIPNIVLLARWVAKLYIAEKARVEN